VTSDVQKKLEEDLHAETETRLAVDRNDGPDNVNNVHKTKHKKARVTQRKTFYCRKCDISFASHSSRKYHSSQMHRTHRCQKCGMVFSGQRNFTKHVHTEHPGLPVYKVFPVR